MTAFEVGDWVQVWKDNKIVDEGEIEKVYPTDNEAMYDVQGEESFYSFVDEDSLWRRK